MEIHPGPPGMKLIKADVNLCSTSTGINERGFFTFENELENGFKFKCQSLINSKVSIKSGFTDGDQEHGTEYGQVSHTVSTSDL